MARTKRDYRPIFALSLVLYACLTLAGVVNSVRSYGHLPEVTLRYTQTYIEGLVEDGDMEGALRQLRLAADIEFINPGTAVTLAELARSAGDLESEIYGLRKVHKNDPRDVDAHNALSDALLRRDPIRPEDAREVIQHGEIVLRLDPLSVEARRHMATAYEVLGRRDLAEEQLREAERLNPSFDAVIFDLSPDERHSR